MSASGEVTANQWGPLADAQGVEVNGLLPYEWQRVSAHRHRP
jgi:hypothetical protein